MEKNKTKYNAYMREWMSKNKDKNNKKNNEKLRIMKDSDPEAYKKFRARANKIDQKYRDSHKEEINKKLKAKNWNYTVEKGKKRRDNYNKKNPENRALIPRKSAAKKNGLLFELTKEWYAEQYQKGCTMTGLPFDEYGSRTPWVAHIDRIIPEKGYTIKNSRLVCACYNIAKKNWSDQDVLKMAKHLIKK